MSFAPQIQAMRRIASQARALRIAALEKLGFKPAAAKPTALQEHIPNICSPPPSISDDLTALGLRPVHATKISSAYQRSALDFKASVEAQYVAALQAQQRSGLGESSKTNSAFAAALVTQYIRALEAWRLAILDRVTQRVHEIRDLQSFQEIPAKKSFNTSAISVLEKVFQNNQRPSRLEKRRLAAQTNMEYKQITVWFQNRRNRSKKGSPAVTPPDTMGGCSPLPPDLATALARILDQYALVEGSAAYEGQPDTLYWAASFAPFHVNRPGHAWPSCYPPLCSDDPFPLAGDAPRFLIPWVRTPVRSPAPSRADTESDLVASLLRWSLKSEDTDQDRRSGETHADAVAVSTPFSPAASDGSLASHSRAHCTPARRESCTGSFQAFDQVSCHGVSTSYSAPSTSHCRTGSVSVSVSTESKHRLYPDTLARGRPYPKGKPSKNLVVQNTSLILRRLRARNDTVSSPAAVRIAKHRFLTPSSPPITLPALERESSVSSLRCVSTSSSVSDHDLLLTPPLFPTSVLDYPVLDFPALDMSVPANTPFKGLGCAPGGAYLGYSVACGDFDPALEAPSALYSQIEPAVPLYPEPRLIPTIGQSVLAY